MTYRVRILLQLLLHTSVFTNGLSSNWTKWLWRLLASYWVLTLYQRRVYLSVLLLASVLIHLHCHHRRDILYQLLLRLLLLLELLKVNLAYYYCMAFTSNFLLVWSYIWYILDRKLWRWHLNDLRSFTLIWRLWFTNIYLLIWNYISRYILGRL